MLGSLKIDTSASLSVTELELLAKAKPNYVEETTSSTATKKRKSKASANNSGDEPSKDGDTATESQPKEAEE